VNERSENRHFQRPLSHLTPPPQGTPANICINFILPETTVRSLGYIFVADSVWVALIVEQFCPKAGDANTLAAEPKIDFNAQRPFKVIYFSIIEEPQGAT